MDYWKKLVVEPGARVRLAERDPGLTSKHDPKKEALPEIEQCRRQIFELQYRLYAGARRSLLIVLQGLDASGKDGTVRHVFAGMNPQGCHVTSFKQPTPADLDHDFLWRVHPHAPARGEVAIFNRSHYEDVLVVRVHGLAPRRVWSRRYDLINHFEETLASDGETTILKFFLHISKEEQLARFAQRLDDPLRQWKVSESDYRERGLWDEYTLAFEEMLARTSTAHAPWFVVPSNHKWFRNLAISHILVDALAGLQLEIPRPKVDVERLRETFHDLSDVGSPHPSH